MCLLAPWQAVLLLVAVGAMPAGGVSYTTDPSSCPTSWTVPPASAAACGAAAKSLKYLVDSAPNPGEAPDGSLPLPKTLLPRTCIVYGTAVFYNPSGIDSAQPTAGITALCEVVRVEPTPAANSPEYNLPPFLAPWDYRTPQATVTVPIPPTETLALLTPEAGATTVTLPVTPLPPSARVGPYIIDVNALAVQPSDAGCIEFETLNVVDANRKATSTFNGCLTGQGCEFTPGIPGSGMHRGRLDDSGWVAGRSNKGQWYQMDMGFHALVSGVVMQGGATTSGAAGAWVTKAKLDYSAEGIYWYGMDNGKIFTASSSYNIKVAVKSENPVLARYVRILPQEWQQWPSLRAGVLACVGRALSFGGIQIRFNTATAQGRTAMGQLPSQRVQTGVAVSQVFEVGGLRQSMGRPDGFTGEWTDDRTYVITFNDIFDGRIDPAVASIYMRDGSGIADAVTGQDASRTGESAGVVFTDTPQGTPLYLPEPDVPDTSTPTPPESSDDTPYVLAAAIITAVPICLLLCYLLYAYCRKQREISRFKEWIREGRATANSRTPGGVSSVRFARMTEPVDGTPERRGSEPALFAPGPLEASWTARPTDAPPPMNPINSAFPGQRR